jgi:hypothetical protein
VGWAVVGVGGMVSRAGWRVRMKGWCESEVKW